MTKGRKLSSDIEPKSDKHIKQVTGQAGENPSDIPSLKYGREMEPKARQKYVEQ